MAGSHQESHDTTWQRLATAGAVNREPVKNASESWFLKSIYTTGMGMPYRGIRFPIHHRDGSEVRQKAATAGCCDNLALAVPQPVLTPSRAPRSGGSTRATAAPSR